MMGKTSLTKGKIKGDVLFLISSQALTAKVGVNHTLSLGFKEPNTKRGSL